MSIFHIEKVISSLPGTLVANTIYVVRTGAGFDLYITDSTGSFAHSLNSSATSNTYIQETEPVSLTPYIWYKTDETGNVTDILKG